jgi:hypothetical protein
MTHDCAADLAGADGEDGQDGKDGADGIDGRDGVDGKDGIDGVDGINGRDGVVPRTWYVDMQDYIAATNAAAVHLPQGKDNRITMGFSSVSGSTGVGFGYAHRFNDDNNAAITLSLGAAGSQKVANASVGWEF